MPVTYLDKHFEVIDPADVERIVSIPGGGAPVRERIALSPLQIRQTGLAEKDATTLADIRSGKGDPEESGTVDALNCGAYLNMAKTEVSIKGEATAAGGIVSYEMTFERVCKPVGGS